MRRTSSLAIIVLLAIVVALITALNATSAQRAHQTSSTTPPPPPFSGTPVIGTPTRTGGHSFKALTSKQKKTILSVIHTDKTFAKLIKSKKYRVTTTYLWVTRGGSFLGGVVSVRLKTVGAMHGTWLYLDYDCTEQSTPPYGRVPYTAKYGNVSAVTLFVDVVRKRVAGIQPLGFLIGKAHYPPSFKAASTPSSCPS